MDMKSHFQVPKLPQSNLNSSILPYTTYRLGHSNQVSSYLVYLYISRNEKEI
jgi:hypothetical protein